MGGLEKRLAARMSTFEGMLRDNASRIEQLEDRLTRGGRDA
jgi:hypothetical protein